MLRKNAWTWLAALAAGGFVVGCGPSSASRTSPPDPLFLSKQPVAGKFDAKPSNQVAEAPTPPNVPVTRLADAHDNPKQLPKNEQPQQEKVVPAVPVSQIKAPKTSDTAAETSASIYGHALDYSWIRGTLDKHAYGYMNIRYCDITEEDTHGGKFTLEYDRRLSTYRDGDIVTIEGELVPLDEGTDLSHWHPFRTYKIRSIRLEQGPN
jgi:hypothetical protein